MERDRRLVGDEYQRLLDLLTEHQERPKNKARHADVFRFAIASTFQLGEIPRITWSDLDTASKIVVIRDRKDPKRKIGNHQRVPLLLGAFEIVMAQRRIDGEDRIFPFNETTISMIVHARRRRARY